MRARTNWKKRMTVWMMKKTRPPWEPDARSFQAMMMSGGGCERDEERDGRLRVFPKLS